MAAVEPPLCDFGWKARDFSLLGVDMKPHTLAQVRGEKGTLIIFICNHCPFVRAIADRLAQTCQKLQEASIGVGAIMSNDVDNHPEDDFQKMQVFAKEHNFTFPYLYDPTQNIAKAYRAVCTPDFFGFDKDLELQYRGRMDASRTTLVEDAKPELLLAMEQIARGEGGPKEQIASIGCNIKWKPAA